MKKTLSFLFVLLLVFSLFIPAYAQKPYDAAVYRVNDFDDYITDDEESLSDMCISFMEKHETDLVVVVAPGIPDEYDSLYDYSDMFYNRNGFGYGESKSGIMLVIDLGRREMYITPFNDNKAILTEEVADAMIEKLGGWLKSDISVYQVIKNYIDEMENVASNQSKAEDSSKVGLKTRNVERSTENLPQKKEKPSAQHKNIVSAAVLGAMFAIFGGLIAVDIEKKKMNNITKEEYAERYLVPGSFKYNKASNVLVSTHVEKKPKQKNANGSGKNSGGSKN